MYRDTGVVKTVFHLSRGTFSAKKIETTKHLQFSFFGLWAQNLTVVRNFSQHTISPIHQLKIFSSTYHYERLVKSVRVLFKNGDKSERDEAQASKIWREI